MKNNNNMKGKYVIIDLRDMGYFKENGKDIVYFDTLDAAAETCGMYEFENVWIMKLEYNYIDEWLGEIKENEKQQ